jgi:hypothetical protein
VSAESYYWPERFRKIRTYWKQLICGEVDDFDVLIEGSTVQVFLQESGRFTVPATRLSDGMLRFLCLLAILCHPNPPSLVCIEEPELGLHPDILPSLADLLKEASGRCQGDTVVKIYTDCHLMVQCMETWFLADRKTLVSFYGKDFSENVLPAKERPVETIDKQQVYQSLENATKNCGKKGKYNKGDHSFQLLASINPVFVAASSPWAKRFIDELKKR